MLETIAGRYNAIELDHSYDQEDLDEVYTSVDEMDGLSDSNSSLPSYSRPTTPSDHLVHPQPRVFPKSSNRDRSSTVESDSDVPHFAVSSKASLILGLVPGTLSHALACLQSARDEARRLFDITPPMGSTVHATDDEPKKSGGRLDRARKAMSIALPSPASMARRGSAGGAPPVIMSVGGEEEEKKRERRRRVADGVLHWQKEVQRLREVEEANIMMVQREMTASGRKGTKKPRR